MILYLGRLAPYKSVDVLINAFAKIRQRVPNARLVIAGSGEDSRRLKLLAGRLKIRSAVEFVGHVNQRQKIALYQKAWVFVNPSLMEGWGITTIEANACGTPAVGADVAGLRDSINNPHTGYLTPHGDIDALADSIGDLLTNSSLRSDMSVNAVKWARRFEWENSSQSALSLVETEAT
jgi:glycosyltransferase involved in cell wall biosynthesis